MAPTERVVDRGLVADERGQTAGEYLGIVVVIAVLVAVLTTTGIGGAIRDAVVRTISSMVS